MNTLTPQGWNVPNNSEGPVRVDRFGRLVDSDGDPLDGSALGGGGRQAISLLSAATAEAAAANAAAIQSALDAGGRYAFVCDGLVANISEQLVLRDDIDLDANRVELRAFSNIGSLMTTEAMLDPGVAVTVTWTAGVTATVNWTAHPFVANEHCWLNKADQWQFCGVFRVISVTDVDTFIVQLMEIPTTAATGAIVARKALERVYLQNLEIDYNAPTNGFGRSDNNLHALQLFGVFDLRVQNVHGQNTQKYLVCSGALARYRFENIGGSVTNSDVLKVYGPAFGGVADGVYAAFSGDDFFSCQTREPAAFAAYDVCHGSVLGLEVGNLYGTSNTGSYQFYASPFGRIDGVKVKNTSDVMGTAVPHCRVASSYTPGTSLVGTITVESIASTDQRALVQIDTGGSATLKVDCLNIIAPNMRSAVATGRLVSLFGTGITANINVYGGFITGAENIINCGTNNGRVSLSLFGLRVGSGLFVAFRGGTAGRLDVHCSGCTFENSFGTTTFNASAGTGIITFSSAGTINVLAAVATYNMGAGSVLRLNGSTDIPLDGTQLEGVIANHAPGASFYNTAAGFGAGVGQYVRGATAWVRTAA